MPTYYSRPSKYTRGSNERGIYPLYRADTGLIASPSVSQTLTNSNYPNGQIRRAGPSLMARTSHKASRLHHRDVIYLALAESPQSSNCSASTCSNALRLEASDYWLAGKRRDFVILVVWSILPVYVKNHWIFLYSESITAALTVNRLSPC